MEEASGIGRKENMTGQNHKPLPSMSVEKVLEELRGNIDYPKQIPLFSICSILLSEGVDTKLDCPSFLRLVDKFPVKLPESDALLLFNDIQQSNTVTISDFVEKLLVCFVLLFCCLIPS